MGILLPQKVKTQKHSINKLYSMLSVYPLTHPLAHLLTLPLTHPRTHPLARPLSHPLTHLNTPSNTPHNKSGENTDVGASATEGSDGEDPDSDHDRDPDNEVVDAEVMEVEAEALPDEPIERPIIDELQVLAVLTALVDVYEAAALASLAAAQELVSTLRSAINAIDETITGTTENPKPPIFGTETPADPKARNNQWLGAAKASSPFAADMGIGPVPTNVKTSLVPTAPGDRQKKIAAKVLREKREQEKILRQQRLQERAAIMKRVAGNSPSRGSTRGGGGGGRETENGRDNAEPTEVEKILHDEIAKVKKELADQLKVQQAQAQGPGPAPGPGQGSGKSISSKQKHKGQGQGQGQEGEEQGETTDGSFPGAAPRALSRGASRRGPKNNVTMAPFAGGLGLGLGATEGQGLMVTMSPEVLAMERKRAVSKTPLAYRFVIITLNEYLNNYCGNYPADS